MCQFHSLGNFYIFMLYEIALYIYVNTIFCPSVCLFICKLLTYYRHAIHVPGQFPDNYLFFPIFYHKIQLAGLQATLCLHQENPFINKVKIMLILQNSPIDPGKK